MNSSQIFLEIIKLALWDIHFDENLLSSLSDEDWVELFEESKRQGLSAIFFDGLDKVCAKSIQCNNFFKNYGPKTVLSSELRWLSQLRLAIKISDLFQQHGINMLLLKGLGISLCYPIPKHRECNDIDIFLFGQYDEGNRLAEQVLGAIVEKFSMKEDHILIDDFVIDNHIHFLWTASNDNIEFDLYLKKLLHQDCLLQFPDSSILLPTPHFNYLFLLSHSYSHFMREGLALRQIVDIAFFLSKYKIEIEWDKMNEDLSKYHLKDFSDAIVSFIQYYFGLSCGFELKTDDKLLKRMYIDIFGKSHAVVYHDSLFAARVFMAKTVFVNRWRYNAFYDGGFKQYVVDKSKKYINNFFNS